MNKPPEIIPKFDTEAQERACRETHDSTEHLDWTPAKSVTAEPETHHPDDFAAPAAAFAGRH
jgi:hypothetical protein